MKKKKKAVGNFIQVRVPILSKFFMTSFSDGTETPRVNRIIMSSLMQSDSLKDVKIWYFSSKSAKKKKNKLFLYIRNNRLSAFSF